MKANRKSVAALIMILSLSILSSCSSDVTTIQMSDEAKALETKIIEKTGGNACFLEENFDKTKQGIMAGIPNVFPEKETKNPVSHYTCAGSEVYTIGDDEYENIILYIHGGAWVYGVDPTHVSFCDILVDELDAKVYMPLYPLAPWATYKEMYPMLETLYDELQTQGKTVYVMGDSAGGNLSLGLMHCLKEKNKQMPDKLVLLAPAADITFSNPGMKEIEKTDPMLASYGCGECAKMYAGDKELTDPLLSPLYSDVSGYPDTLLVVGTNDILTNDNIELFEKLQEAGVYVHLVKGEGLWHVFSVSDIPERAQTIKIIKNFCK